MADIPSQFTVVTGQVLTAAEWNDDVRNAINFLLNPPCCRIYSDDPLPGTASNNTLASSTSFSTLSWNLERYDTDAMHSTVTNLTRITIVTPGKYTVGCTLQMGASASATGYRDLRTLVNGATIIDYDRRLGNTTVDAALLEVTTEYQFAAGDYIEFQVRQNSGSSLVLSETVSYTPECWARWFSV